MGEAGQQCPWDKLIAGGVDVARAEQCRVDVGGAQALDEPGPAVRVEGRVCFALVSRGLLVLLWFVGCVGVVVACCLCVA